MPRAPTLIHKAMEVAEKCQSPPLPPTITANGTARRRGAGLTKVEAAAASEVERAESRLAASAWHMTG